MIIRKPYAFLIKNFKKIHIFLLLVCLFIFYKNSQTRSFVSEFLSLGTYDAYNEPISNYINFFVMLLLVVVIALSVVLMLLLRHKGKPWKLYLIPFLEYSYMLVVFVVTINFFASYNGSGGTTGIRAIRDLLNISSIFQYAVFIILLIRILGIDLNKFNFKMDSEYLELDSDDREEFEINIDIDKNSFKRTYKRLFRNINYVYQEHKFIINCLITLLIIGLVSYSYYYVFIVHKSYKQGDSINSSGYTITINDSYYTDKNYNGEVISKDSSFVVIDLNIKNNVGAREINFNRFHIMNGVSNYSYTFKTYESDFSDLGKTYEKKEIKRDEEFNLIMVFKVDKKLDKNRFVLYYQEFDNNKPYLRKIKLNIKDISSISVKKEKKIDEELIISEGNEKKDLTIENIEIDDNFTYSYQNCTNSSGCYTSSGDVNNKEGEKILKIDFISDSFEGKDLIDFSTKYGKINYIDDKGKEQVVSIKDAVNKKYFGKYLYIRVPSNIDNSNEIRLIYTVRNNRYTYRIK